MYHYLWRKYEWFTNICTREFARNRENNSDSPKFSPISSKSNSVLYMRNYAFFIKKYLRSCFRSHDIDKYALEVCVITAYCANESSPQTNQHRAAPKNSVIPEWNIWSKDLWEKGWTGKVFSLGRAGQGQKSVGQGRGLSLRSGQGGAHTAYISWLKSYATAEVTLICIALKWR